MKTLLRTIVLCGCWAGLAVAAEAEDTTLFESKIRPLLIERCYQCHSADRKEEGGLQLDTRDGWRVGGDSGAAIVPGDPEASPLVQRIRSHEADLVMPPRNTGEPLTAQQIDDLVTWIRDGAVDPRLEPAPGVAAKTDWNTTYQQRLDWWSLRPVQPVVPPEVADADWARTAVDRFLRQAMSEQAIDPAPLADPSTLLRRASLVLTGLPPTPELADEFLADWSSDPAGAFTRLTDRLIESPQFGERFARHWLDVVRFSETHGNEWNYDAAYAWRYRDYLIRAFNSDVPYDRFIREQIAGDALSTPRRSPDVPYDESPIGTAFYRFGEVNHDSCSDFPVIGYDILDNQLDTLTKAFQATTAACARCHDHKLDAISQKDYYALLAVLRSSRPVMRTLDPADLHRETVARLQSLKSEIRTELATLWQAQAQSLTGARLDELVANLKDQALPLESPLHVWREARKSAPEQFATGWNTLSTSLASEAVARTQFNEANFKTLADFRERIPEGWVTEGHGLQQAVGTSADFLPATEGDAAIKTVLPAGLVTYSVSERLNGALRSPTLQRSHAKISFEVQGGRFSLTRLVFNNCQLNYDRQHSIHHDAWSWVTIKWPDKSDQLNPYVELLTFWDNPKFPDPLGTLGNDVEVQREPYDVHAKDPRSWWGLRRIVLHDCNETPKPSLTHLDRLLTGNAPASPDELAARYAAVAADVVSRFGEARATDDDVAWLDWLMRSGLLPNRADASATLAELLARYRELEATLSPPTISPALADESTPVSQPLFARGDLQKPREAVERGYLKMLAQEGPTIAPTSSGRRELAELIASPANPLTARVMVNRVWQWIFGRGLVGTPDDFGHLGEQPLHPELLDHLAARFVAEGWSIKTLVRELVRTRSFQSSGRPTEVALRLDPQNHAFSHYSSRGAEAEVIRDSLLAVAGRLDLKMYGPSVHPYRAAADTEKRLFAGPLDGDGRRSIYIKFQLMEQPAFLRAFNLPGGKVTEGRRGSSHTVEQSLAMLNDPLVLALADRWAGAVLADGAATPAARVRTMFRRAFARDPAEVELSRFLAAINEYSASRGIGTDAQLASAELWREVAHTLFNLQEFRFIP